MWRVNALKRKLAVVERLKVEAERERQRQIDITTRATHTAMVRAEGQKASISELMADILQLIQVGYHAGGGRGLGHDRVFVRPLAISFFLNDWTSFFWPFVATGRPAACTPSGEVAGSCRRSHLCYCPLRL